MNLSLLHNQPIRSKHDNQLPKDIASIVAQRLDELEKSADAPSEFSAAHSEIYIEEKAKDSPPETIKDNHEEHVAYSQEKQIESTLRKATHQKTTSDIKNHSSSMQIFLQSWFRSDLILLIIELLHTTILRPIPVIAASFLSLVSSLSLLMWSLSSGTPLNTSAIVIVFAAGYVMGLCIDIIKLRGTHSHQ